MLEPMPEAERLEVVVLVNIDAVLDRIRGDSGGLQLRSELVRVVHASQRADELIDRRGILNARSRRHKSRFCRSSQYSEHPSPLLVICDGDRDPSFVTVLVGASIRAVRSVAL